jgi:superfamily II DNA or RNA helicase
VPVGIIGDQRTDYRDVTVAMVQTLDRRTHDDFLRTRNVLIADEVHLSTGDQWQKNLQAIHAHWRFGLTATPQTGGTGMHLLAHTGKIIVEKTAKELIEAGVLVRPRIWFFQNAEPKLSKTLPWRAAYRQGITDNPYRHELTKRAVCTFRVEEKPTLCLVAHLNHGRILCNYFTHDSVRVEFIHGGVKKPQRVDILGRLCDKKLDCVVAQCETIGVGTDLPPLRAVINATGFHGGGSSSDGDLGRDSVQYIGRLLRAYPGKEYGDYVDFVDSCQKRLADASLTRLSVLEDEGYASYINYWSSYIPE